MCTGSTADFIAKARSLFLPSLLLLLLVFATAYLAALADSDKLQGQVEETGVLPVPQSVSKPTEPMPVPVLPHRRQQHLGSPENASEAEQDLTGGATKEEVLQGKVEQTRLGQPEHGAVDNRTGSLQGFATADEHKLEGQVSQDDPDIGDKELMVEWDRWRNRFLHAIQSGMQESLNNPTEETVQWNPVRRAMTSRFPLGTTAWFSCQVTPARHVIHIKLLRSSGYPAYDRAVLDAIDSLQGCTILQYPRGSKRQIVTQLAGIKTAEQSEYRYFHFGDIERQHINGGGGF